MLNTRRRELREFFGSIRRHREQLAETRLMMKEDQKEDYHHPDTKAYFKGRKHLCTVRKDHLRSYLRNIRIAVNLIRCARRHSVVMNGLFQKGGCVHQRDYTERLAATKAFVSDKFADEFAIKYVPESKNIAYDSESEEESEPEVDIPGFDTSESESESDSESDSEPHKCFRKVAKIVDVETDEDAESETY